jgi:hypothetical protein
MPRGDKSKYVRRVVAEAERLSPMPDDVSSAARVCVLRGERCPLSTQSGRKLKTEGWTGAGSHARSAPVELVCRFAQQGGASKAAE